MPETGQWTLLAVLRAPDLAAQNAGQVRAIFTPDSRRLIVVSEGSSVHDWDIAALRTELADLGLNW